MSSSTGFFLLSSYFLFKFSQLSSPSRSLSRLHWLGWRTFFNKAELAWGFCGSYLHTVFSWLQDQSGYHEMCSWQSLTVLPPQSRKWGLGEPEQKQSRHHHRNQLQGLTLWSPCHTEPQPVPQSSQRSYDSFRPKSWTCTTSYPKYQKLQWICQVWWCLSTQTCPRTRQLILTLCQLCHHLRDHLRHVWAICACSSSTRRNRWCAWLLWLLLFAEPSLVILQALGHLIQKSLEVVLKIHSKVVEVPLEFPDFQELESNPFPVTQRWARHSWYSSAFAPTHSQLGIRTSAPLPWAENLGS